jgi:acetyl-CoA carboxylase carboxyl transferase subunit alpha
MAYYLEFEKPIEELEMKIEELRRLSDGTDLDITNELSRLENKVNALLDETFSSLTRWQKTQIARHPDRPYSQDYIRLIVDDFFELHGDRRFADDPAVVGGIGKIDTVSAVIVGHQKGRGVKQRISRNFGQPHPEGYRKALRLMKLAERFSLPVITLIDTPGAYPGIGAEERGQAEAIATNLQEMSRLRTPIISIVIGEGGSGGALALSVADRLYLLEHAVYSVISPEGCASILWSKNGNLGAQDFSRAADALKLTAQDLRKFKVIDDIIPEPLGGAHRNRAATAQSIKTKVLESLAGLKAKSIDTLLEERYSRLRNLGLFIEEIGTSSPGDASGGA